MTRRTTTTPRQEGGHTKMTRRKLIKSNRGPAVFVAYGQDAMSDRTVRLNRNTMGYAVDVEGIPALTRTFPTAAKAVEYFAGLREMTIKDYGASEVEWGSYPELKRYWPADKTPPDEEVG